MQEVSRSLPSYIDLGSLRLVSSNSVAEGPEVVLQDRFQNSVTLKDPLFNRPPRVDCRRQGATLDQAHIYYLDCGAARDLHSVLLRTGNGSASSDALIATTGRIAQETSDDRARRLEFADE